SRQTASRVDSDGLRPEFRRSPSLRLNKTGRRGPTARAEVEECCAVPHMTHKDCCIISLPSTEPELKV
ncbi:hypothetical protein B0J13DRAFT_423041, partial [Dactylonectria estremocensis]